MHKRTRPSNEAKQTKGSERKVQMLQQTNDNKGPSRSKQTGSLISVGGSDASGPSNPIPIQTQIKPNAKSMPKRDGHPKEAITPSCLQAAARFPRPS